nr:transcription regulator [Hymenolepis microstoma]
MPSTEESVRERLQLLNPTHLEITDFSDGCGLKLKVEVVSEQFVNKTLLQQHRMVNDLLKEEMAEIHALSLSTFTPEKWAAKN